MPDDTQQYQQPESAKWLTIIGSLLGGARGRPIGSTLMGLGGLADQKAQQAWQQAQWKQFLNTAKQKGVIDENHAALLEQVPPEAQAKYYQDLVDQMNPKPKEQAPVKVQMPDKAGKMVSGLYDPNTGATQWLSEGEGFAEKPPQPKTLSGEEAVIASQLGLNEDPSQWNAAQAASFEAAKTKLSNERKPNFNVNVNQPLSPSDITKGPKGQVGVWERNKAGELTFKPMEGATPKEKEWTAKDAANLVKTTEANAKAELTDPGWIFKGVPSGQQSKRKALWIRAQMGYDAFGMPLKDGQTVTDESGQPLLGPSGKPIIWRDNASR
jgi:hypothetical protein